MNCSYGSSTETEMFCVSLPGVEDVDDGSVDYYPIDWELSDNENEGSCPARRSCCCTENDVSGGCIANNPDQNDQQDYEIITE